MYGNKVNGGLELSIKSYPIVITQNTVNGRVGASKTIYPALKRFTKRFISDSKYGIRSKG
ncbi:hypothetical protein NVP1091O_26 [Vibrio phage 1.091.O._10N.286.52.B12]|nr:hypothetical protein NVP1091O_26 [Vibrio phage 1.091.O._10N.286.52.B12]